jgi:hypothetical protein
MPDVGRIERAAKHAEASHAAHRRPGYDFFSSRDRSRAARCATGWPA